MVLKACPEIADYAVNGIGNWRDLMITAAQVRGYLGVSPSAYEAGDRDCLHSAKGAAHQLGRRLFAGIDRQGDGRAVLSRADADGSAQGERRDGENGRMTIANPTAGST
ncbi:hypothetical protein ACVILI_006923 [Mesorhizobium sp. USDA 4775]